MRGVLGIVVRVAFVLAVVAFAVWGFWDDWPRIWQSVIETAPWRIVTALALACLGLALTLPVWIAIAVALGCRFTIREAAHVLFISQLGKYIPGSIWSVGAQMQLAREHRVPLRTSAAIGLLFIGVNLASSVVVAGVATATRVLPVPVPWWVGVAAALVGLAALSPPVLAWLGRLLTVRAVSPHVTLRSSTLIACLMATSWAAWGMSAWVLLAGSRWSDYPLTFGATSLAYAVGLVVILAPAGIGVREGVLVALLAPSFGVPTAASIALLSRLTAAIADFSAAGIAHVASRCPHAALEPERELPRGRLG